MKVYFTLALFISALLFSCKKYEGEGGRSSIKGRIYMKDQTGSNQGEYFAPNLRVFIIYGAESTVHDDDMRTSYDGSFEFKNLREGEYKIYAYSEDPNEVSGLTPVIKQVELGKKETLDIGIIELEK